MGRPREVGRCRTPEAIVGPRLEKKKNNPVNHPNAA